MRSQKETLELSCLLCLTRPGKTKPPVLRLCHNYYQQNHDLSDSSVTNYFLNLGVKPLQKLALKVPVLNCDTASKRVVLFYPQRVKQSRHEMPMVFFCDPVQSTGFSKQTINFLIILLDYEVMLPAHSAGHPGV